MTTEPAKPELDPTSKEPAAITGVVWSFVSAALVLVVSFGLPITDKQQAALLGIIAPAVALVVAFRIRGKVFAPATVAQMQERD